MAVGDGMWGHITNVKVHRHDGPMVLLPTGGLVTPCHCFRRGAHWHEAQKLWAGRGQNNGLVYNLEVGEFNTYELEGGMVAHNALK